MSDRRGVERDRGESDPLPRGRGLRLPARPRADNLRAVRPLARKFCLLGVALALAAATPAVGASAAGRVSIRGERKPATPAALAKVATALRAGPADPGRAAGGTPGLRAKDLPPSIEIRLHQWSDDLLARMATAGMEVESAHPEHGRIYGVASPAVVTAMATWPEVATIHPSYPPVASVGSTTSQADASIRADLARQTFSVDGSGVRVGILSDSYRVLTGGDVEGAGCERSALLGTAQVWGDLPDRVRLLADAASGSDEGRAMAELIHDLAPGAELAFHTALGGEAVFAAGIDRLVECGADVIVDDIIYFLEPLFQDGIVADAAARAVAAGRPFFSAAGNNGTVGIDELYADSAPGETGELGLDFHDFGGGRQLAGFTLPPGCDIDLILQWSEPFDGQQGEGAATDLDLYAVECSGTDCTVVTSSIDAQGCSRVPAGPGGDPVEVIGLVNEGDEPAEVFLAVDRVCGAAPRFRVVSFAGCSLDSFGFDPSIFDGPQLFGHAAASGVVAVGAVPFFEIDSGGGTLSPTGRIDVERFSSRGGDLPFFFDASGSALAGAPVLRRKPEIAAPDGTNTTFFSPGGDIDLDEDRAPNFFGTSAAAPHAAAVAALMLERSPSLSPAEITSILQSTASDVAETGIDDRAGAGLIDAARAVDASPEGRTQREVLR